MTAVELAKLVGRKGMALLSASAGAGRQLRCPVEVKDARENFGRTELLVTPVGGSGEAWISDEKFEEA